jgi:hypothetical protein
MDASYDEDGDLMVRDNITCWVVPNNDRKDRVQLFSIFRFEANSSPLQRLECVNAINREYIVVKAVDRKNDKLIFEYDILVAGGITKKAFVLAVKQFCAIPRSAVAEHGAGIIA